MGFIKYLLIILVGVASFVIYRHCPCLMKMYQQPNFEQFKQDGYWGIQILKPNEKPPMDPSSIEPFHLNISQADLADLRERLVRSRFIDHIHDTRFHYGFNSETLKKIQQHWLNQYNWRKHERSLNELPQYRTKLEGLMVHFIHMKPKQSSKVKTILPLLMVHGWPGSFYEYTKMVPMLIEPDSFGVAFEVIVPSIPGYGYSEAPHQQGFHMGHTARMFVKLMKRLGHERFFALGGDWGNAITRTMAAIYPEKVRGLHLIGNFIQPSKPCDYIRWMLAYLLPQYYFGGDDYQRQYDKVFPISEKMLLMLRETGYMHLQATRPDTIGTVLMDSPIGMAAYIMEKWSVWTNFNHLAHEHGGLFDGNEPFSLDDLLTNVMIYWTSGNIASSQRFYLENLHQYNTIMQFGLARIQVPTGTIDPSNDLQRAPEKLIKPFYENLIQYTEINGGHFMALEKPKEVVNDFRMFIEKVLIFEQKKKQIEDEQKKQQKGEI